MSRVTIKELEHAYDLEAEYDEEAALLKDTLEMLYILGAYVIRNEANVRKGIADLTVCFKGRFVGIELKDKTGKVSAQQLNNMEKVRKAGGVADSCRTLADVLILLHMV